MTSYRNRCFSWFRRTGKAVIGVRNCWSPKVSSPEMVEEVALKGNASAKP